MIKLKIMIFNFMAKIKKSGHVPPTLHYCGHNAKRIFVENLQAAYSNWPLIRSNMGPARDLRILIRDVTQEMMDTLQMFFMLFQQKNNKVAFSSNLALVFFSVFRWRMKITDKRQLVSRTKINWFAFQSKLIRGLRAESLVVG